MVIIDFSQSPKTQNQMNNKQHHDQMMLETWGFRYMGKAIFKLVFHFGMKKKYSLNPAEAFQTSGIFLIVAFIILTLTCALLRGTGMKLILGGA